MEVRVKTFRVGAALLLIAIGIVLRLLPHEPNFAPVGAIALFGGAVLGWRTALWLPLVIMAASDFFLGFYPGWWFTWLGFIGISLFGTLLAKSSFWLRVPVGALGAGVIFYLVSNFGVWLISGMYAHTWQGLAQCFYLALPFFRSSLLADIFYSFVFFGAYALAHHWALRKNLGYSHT